MAARSRSSWSRRALALLLGALVSAFLLELGVSVFLPEVDRARTARTFSPRFGAVPKDSWIFDFRIDPRVHHSVEMRGQRIALKKPRGQTRVLVLGDSATQGAFVRREQAYPERLATLLVERGERNVSVINAGEWGMTTIDELCLLEDKLLPLEPDVVVLGLFMANDLNMNLLHPFEERRYHAPSWLSFARERSALVHLLYLDLLALNQRFGLIEASALGARFVPRQLALVDQRGLHYASYPAGELALYLREGSSLEQEAYRMLSEALLQMRELGRKHGFVVRVLLIPTPSSVAGRLSVLAHPRLLEELRQRGVAIEESELDFQRPTRRVLALCEELELTCLDPLPALRKLGVRRAFFPHDEHPTAAAHDLLARALLSER